MAHRKVVARQIAKGYLGGLRSGTFERLRDVGFFAEKFRVDVLDGDVIPWLYDETFRHVQELGI